MPNRLGRDEARTALIDYVYGSDHPDLTVYRADFGTKFSVDWWLDGIMARCRLAGFFDRRLLEVGCGFGWDAAALALLGGNSVVAVDILPSMIDGVNECLATAKAKGHDIAVEARQGDICKLDLPTGSFDGIYSSEAIEHVHDLAAMFARCRELLRPGGKMLIVNDSNRYNTAFREATIAMWRLRDRSWDHAEWLKREVRPVEHAEAEPFAVTRKKIIASLGTQLDAEQIARLAAATAGMNRVQIEAATVAVVAGEALPVPPEFAWCRNPETGEYAERLLDPFELRDMLRAADFKRVRLRHGFNRFPFRLLNGVKIKPINAWLFDRRPLFMLTAER